MKKNNTGEKESLHCCPRGQLVAPVQVKLQMSPEPLMGYAKCLGEIFYRTMGTQRQPGVLFGSFRLLQDQKAAFFVLACWQIIIFVI